MPLTSACTNSGESLASGLHIVSFLIHIPLRCIRVAHLLSLASLVWALPSVLHSYTVRLRLLLRLSS